MWKIFIAFASSVAVSHYTYYIYVAIQQTAKGVL